MPSIAEEKVNQTFNLVARKVLDILRAIPDDNERALVRAALVNFLKQSDE